MAVTGSYQKDGEKKAIFKQIGEVFEGKNGGKHMKLYMIPEQIFHLFEETDEKKGKPVEF